jgi:hypothetical protein
MTIYTIKKDKHTTVKTTQLHEARKIAKQVLINRLKEKCDNTMYLVSTGEKMYVYQGETQIRFYATMSRHGGGFKTYSVTIKCISIADGGYDFDLHTEIFNGYKNIKGAE